MILQHTSSRNRSLWDLANSLSLCNLSFCALKIASLDKRKLDGEMAKEGKHFLHLCFSSRSSHFFFHSRVLCNTLQLLLVGGLVVNWARLIHQWLHIAGIITKHNTVRLRQRYCFHSYVYLSVDFSAEETKEKERDCGCGVDAAKGEANWKESRVWKSAISHESTKRYDVK